MLEIKNSMCTWRYGALIGKKAMYGGRTDSKASEEAEVGAGSGCLGSEEA